MRILIETMMEKVNQVNRTSFIPFQVNGFATMLFKTGFPRQYMIKKIQGASHEFFSAEIYADPAGIRMTRMFIIHIYFKSTYGKVNNKLKYIA